ncbi:alpha/beta fold hydrolase [Sutcliffiella halmapala]|uniref:alpha/beta fold hydrolase n=1 Tax=Sutcliffiella halmapala TaxID=79882 RepID=UPI000995058F|nr:alpha/beta hydrolase [Sutcliffiella halmapala]
MILHTSIFGNGEAIVFLHTGLQTGLTDFEYQREYFKQYNKVILPDLRGHGQSKTEKLDNFFEDSVLDLVDTLNSLDVPTAHIVGCSLGGMIGLMFAKRFPERVKSLTISGVIPEKPEDWEVIQGKEAEKLAGLLQNEELGKYFDSVHYSNWREMLQLTLESDWYPFHETKDVTAIKVPVLFLVGEGKKHEVIGAITYPKANENIHVSVIPFASHLVHAEQPQLYTNILEVFLKKYNNNIID